MKRLWKKICLGALVFTSLFCMSACGKSSVAVSQDLDGDGVITEWETLFEPMAESSRVVVTEKQVFINDLAGLKAIDPTATNTAYILKKDIDCGGEALCIDLGKTNYLYGNNHIISNYNIGQLPIADESAAHIENVNAIMYNGAGVYDLRLFMGIENFQINSAVAQTFYATNFYKVSVLDTIDIKGTINVSPAQQDVNESQGINISMLTCQEPYKVSVIKNINVCGNLNYNALPGADKETYIKIGGISVNTTSGTTMSDVNMEGRISVNTSFGNDPITVGMIAAVNEGFITTATATGTIAVNFNEKHSVYCGGIVGTNNPYGSSVNTFGLAEIKNSTSNAVLDIVGGENAVSSNMYLGGIAGVSKNGIIDYCTNNGTILATKIKNAKIGGIVGLSEKSTLDNLITRGSINLTNADMTDVAEIAGFATKGIIKHVLAVTTIDIDNKAIAGNIRMGMGTIFESSNRVTFDSGIEGQEPISFYETDNSPMFDGILIGGEKILTRSLNSGSLTTGLGLRNVYYSVREKLDGETYVEELVTKVPFLYKDLFYLSNYRITDSIVNGETTDNKNIVMTNAVVSGVQKVKVAGDSIVFKPDWFVKNLDFNYGLEYTEIDLSGVNTNEKVSSLRSVKFTLSEEKANTRYFDKKYYNGELKYFDYFIEDAYIYGIDEKYSLEDELLSLFVNLISYGENASLHTMLITEDYFKDYSVSEEDQSVSVDFFAVNIKSMLEKIYDSAIVTFIQNDGNPYEVGNEDMIRYLECVVEDSAHKYVITLDLDRALLNGQPTFAYKHPAVDYTIDSASGFYYMVDIRFEVK